MYLERALPWETTCLEGPHSWQKVPPFSAVEPVTKDHPSQETIILWPMWDSVSRQVLQCFHFSTSFVPDQTVQLFCMFFPVLYMSVTFSVTICGWCLAVMTERSVFGTLLQRRNWNPTASTRSVIALSSGVLLDPCSTLSNLAIFAYLLRRLSPKISKASSELI